MDYAILQNEMLPAALQNKPRWMTCMVCTAGLLAITLSAVTVGAFIGYTYCYVEHRSGFRRGNITHTTKFEILTLPSDPAKTNKETINSVLFSSALVSKIIEIGQTFKDDIRLPWTNSNSALFTGENLSSKCLEK